MTTLIIAQIIGLVGMALDVYATLNKSDKRLIRIHALGSYIFSLHYFLLGAYPGAIAEILNGTRTSISSFTQSKLLAVIFIGIYMTLTILIPENLIETAPFIAAILITIGLYFFRGINMRLFYLIGFALWLAYSIIVNSIGGIIVFAILLCTTSLTIWRLHKEKR
ncbi:MAG: YgjV family protein [Alphaproteobacteria bacterium]|nr:YgjV family protein [Alphaproteobacteria bacterium]